MSFQWHDSYSGVSADSFRTQSFLFFCVLPALGSLQERSGPNRPQAPLSTYRSFLVQTNPERQGHRRLSFHQIQFHLQSFLHEQDKKLRVEWLGSVGGLVGWLGGVIGWVLVCVLGGSVVGWVVGSGVGRLGVGLGVGWLGVVV